MENMEKKEESEYTTASIPISLAEKIDQVLAKAGYQNRADFVRDAIRRLLTDIEKGVL
jgi:metal-responsive CopG/Arc/MetJ family transcriptional regulator